jgi:hypothetical protein
MDLPAVAAVDRLRAFLKAHAQVESVHAVLFAQGEDLYRQLQASPPGIPEWGRFLVALGQLAAEADDLGVASTYFLRAVREAEFHGDFEAAITAGYDQGVLFERRERQAQARAAYRVAASEGFRLGAVHANTIRAGLALMRLHFAEYGSLDATTEIIAKQSWLGWLYLRSTTPERLDGDLVHDLERTFCALLLPEEPEQLAHVWRQWPPASLRCGDERFDGDEHWELLFTVAAEAASTQLRDESPDPGQPYRLLAAAARRSATQG